MRDTESMTQDQENKFGLHLESCRKQRGLSRMDLAYKVGVHLNTLAGWERGSSKPSFEHLRLLRELLPALG